MAVTRAISMKHYHLYIFSQNDCEPCKKLKEHVAELPETHQREIDFVPLRTLSRQRTALAQELKVDKTPTLVVVYENEACTLDEGDEFCELFEIPVEKVIGAKEIIRQLPSLIDAYTYANPAE